MRFEQTAVLIGVVGKKGTGTLDNGQQWTTDRVELHVLSAFSEADSMAHGQTVLQYAVENYAEHYEKAKALIDQQVVLQMEMQPAKKLGQAPKIVCNGFYGKLPEPKTKAAQA